MVNYFVNFTKPHLILFTGVGKNIYRPGPAEVVIAISTKATTQ